MLAVSSYSANKDLAIDLVMFLTGREEQKRRALAGSLNLTIPALYDDADIRRDAPFIAQLRPIFEHAVARPSAVTKAQLQQGFGALFRHRPPGAVGWPRAEPALARLAKALRREQQRRGWSG